MNWKVTRLGPMHRLNLMSLHARRSLKLLTGLEVDVVTADRSTRCQLSSIGTDSTVANIDDMTSRTELIFNTQLMEMLSADDSSWKGTAPATICWWWNLQRRFMVYSKLNPLKANKSYSSQPKTVKVIWCTSDWRVNGWVGIRLIYYAILVTDAGVWHVEG